MFGDSNDEISFPHKSLLTNTQVSKIHKAFSNGSLANIKLSKTELSKMVQLGGFLGRLLGPLLKTGLLLMKNVLKTLAKSVLIPLELTISASATDAAIQKKIFWSGMATLIVLNEVMNDNTKIVKSLEESGIMVKSVTEKSKNEAK